MGHSPRVLKNPDRLDGLWPWPRTVALDVSADSTLEEWIASPHDQTIEEFALETLHDFPPPPRIAAYTTITRTYGIYVEAQPAHSSNG